MFGLTGLSWGCLTFDISECEQFVHISFSKGKCFTWTGKSPPPCLGPAAARWMDTCTYLEVVMTMDRPIRLGWYLRKFRNGLLHTVNDPLLHFQYNSECRVMHHIWVKYRLIWRGECMKMWSAFNLPQMYSVDLADGKYTWKKIVHEFGSAPSPRDKLCCWVYGGRWAEWNITVIWFAAFWYDVIHQSQGVAVALEPI